MSNKPEILADTLAELVRQTRTTAYSQNELTKRVEVSRSTIQTIEKGANVESRTNEGQ